MWRKTLLAMIRAWLRWVSGYPCRTIERHTDELEILSASVCSRAIPSSDLVRFTAAATADIRPFWRAAASGPGLGASIAAQLSASVPARSSRAARERVCLHAGRAASREMVPENGVGSRESE